MFGLALLVLVPLCINHMMVVFLVLVIRSILNFGVGSVQVLRGARLAQDRWLLRHPRKLWWLQVGPLYGGASLVHL